VALAIVILARLAQFIIMAVGMKVMTSLLSPLELGTVSLVVTTTGLLAMVFVNPVGMYLNRYIHLWVESRVFKIIFIWMIKYLFYVACISVILIMILRVNVHLMQLVSVYWVVGLICGSLIFNSIVQTLIPSFNTLGDRIAWGVLTVGWVGTGLIFSSAAVLLFGNLAFYWLAGALLSHVIFATVAYRHFFKKFPGDTCVQRPFKNSDLIKFAFPIALSVFFNWLQFQGYRLYLADQIGLQELGFFYAGYSLAAWIMGAVELTVTAMHQPNLYKDAHSKDQIYAQHSWRRYSNRVIPYYLISCFAIIVLADDLILVLLGQEYKSVSSYVIVGALAELSRIWIGHISLLFHLELNTNKLINPMIGGSIVAVLGSIFLVPSFGIIAAPATSSAVALFLTVFVLLSVRFETQSKSFAIHQVVGITILSGLTGWIGILTADALWAGHGIFGAIARILAFSLPGVGVFAFLTLQLRNLYGNGVDWNA